MTSADRVHWGLADNEGTIRDVIGSTGTLLNHVKFDSYGNSILGTAPITDFLFGYTGRIWDPASGLYNNRARWYDPKIGRFLSEDPWGFAAGDANLYRYCRNNPINLTDPSGLCSSWLGSGSGNSVSVSGLGTVRVSNPSYIDQTLFGSYSGGGSNADFQRLVMVGHTSIIIWLEGRSCWSAPVTYPIPMAAGDCLMALDAGITGTEAL